MVREVALHRVAATKPPAVRVNLHLHDGAGRRRACFDARFSARREIDATVNPNSAWHLSYAGRVLKADSADAGTQHALFAAHGSQRIGRDARTVEQRFDHDALGRGIAIHESVAGSSPRCVERFTWGAADAAASTNLRGRPVRHDDPAGACEFTAYSLAGAPTIEARHFLQSLAAPDWPVAPAARALLQEPACFTTQWQFNALKQEMARTDAAGHSRLLAYTLAGQLCRVDLLLASGDRSRTLAEASFDAAGRRVRERAGNGAVSECSYDAPTGRLARRFTYRNAVPAVLQDVRYHYDPVGNPIQREDVAKPAAYHANQRVSPVCSYVYDSLYQLIEASGRECATSVVPGAGVAAHVDDATRLTKYTRRYEHDAAGNLLRVRHRSARSSASFTQEWMVAPDSNRALLLHSDDAAGPAEGAFDAAGNLQKLYSGQRLSWNSRNQLRELTPVVRGAGEDDREEYVYDGGGRRLRKVRQWQARTLQHREEVRYLPGLELREDTASGERVQVILADGLSPVRILHWVSEVPAEFSQDQCRYGVADELGSVSLELDADARTLGYEEYYPYGGSAVWTPASELDAKYKVVRYSGKERDASGLYYYGFRYYAPGLARWLNPDPARPTDGNNLFCFCRGNPVRYVDPDGCSPVEASMANSLHFNWLRRNAMERREGDKEQALKNIASWRPGTVGSHDEYLRYFSAAIDDADISINLPSRIVASISSSHIKNMWDTTGFSPEEGAGRDAAERLLFQYANSPLDVVKKYALRSTAVGQNADFDANSRPVYAALAPHEDSPDERPGAAPAYGNTAFYLKPRVKLYSTVTARDSFFLSTFRPFEAPSSVGVFSTSREAANVYPVIARADRSQLDQMAEGIGGASIPRLKWYPEVQIHGQVLFHRDVQSFAAHGVLADEQKPLDNFIDSKRIGWRAIRGVA
jgi:insecticidal toxin complex protein TccC